MNIETLIDKVLSYPKHMTKDEISQDIMNKIDVGEISDGYHTFDELYMHRRVLFSIICHQYKHLAWKSWKHSDGTMFDGVLLLVSIHLMVNIHIIMVSNIGMNLM